MQEAKERDYDNIKFRKSNTGIRNITLRKNGNYQVCTKRKDKKLCKEVHSLEEALKLLAQWKKEISLIKMSVEYLNPENMKLLGISPIIAPVSTLRDEILKSISENKETIDGYGTTLDELEDLMEIYQRRGN